MGKISFKGVDIKYGYVKMGKAIMDREGLNEVGWGCRVEEIIGEE